MLLREQKLLQKQRLLVAQFADDTRGILPGSACSHRDGLQVAGIDAFQTIDDMQDIMTAAFLAVGHDVDARAVLVLDGLERGSVEQPRKLGAPELFSATVEGEAETVEQ